MLVALGRATLFIFLIF